MSKQIVYRDDELEKFYLSPYTDVYRLSETKVLMKRRDTGKYVILTVSSKIEICTIIEELEKGLDNVHAIALFGKRKLFDMLLDSGVIE